MSALDVLRRARRQVRSIDEASLLARVVVIMGLLPCAMRLPIPTLLRWLERIGAVVAVPPGPRADRAIRYVASCARLGVWGFQDNCVARSLTLFTLLNHPSAPLDVAFGVEANQDNAGRLRLGRRHVWLLKDGEPYLESEPLANYVGEVRYRTLPAQDAGRGEGSNTAALAATLGASSAGAALIALAAVARTKLVAVSLGPAGLGLANQVSTGVIALTGLATFGMGAGTTRYLAEAVGSRDERRAAEVVRTSVTVLAAACGAVVSIGLVLAAPIAGWMFGDTSAAPWVRWLLAAVPLTASVSLATSVLRGTQQAMRLATAQGLGAAAGILAVFMLVRGGELSVVVLLPLAIMTAHATSLAVAAWPVLSAALRQRLARFDPALALATVRYGLVNVVTTLSVAVAMIAIGRAYLSRGDYATAGRIAALAWLGEPLINVLVAGFYASVFPAYCAASPREAPQLLSRAVRTLVLCVTPVLLVGSLAAGPLVRLLFSHAFDDVGPLVGTQLLATFLRTSTVVIGIPLLARGRLLAVTAPHLAWCVMLVASALWWIPGPGPRAFALSSLVTTAGHLVCVALIGRACGCGPRRRDLALVAGGALPLGWMAS